MHNKLDDPQTNIILEKITNKLETSNKFLLF